MVAGCASSSVTGGSGNYHTMNVWAASGGGSTNTLPYNSQPSSGTVTFNQNANSMYIVNNGGNFAVTQPSAPLRFVGKQRIKLGDKFYDTVGEVLEVDTGQELTIKLPDNACIFIHKDGSYVINDKHANVVRKGNKVLEFNRYVNASDLLEEFIKDLGVCGVKQDQVLEIPVDLFINWLIIRAAEKDGEDPPSDVPRLETQVKYKPPQCRSCGRFITQKNNSLDFLFCDRNHCNKYALKHGIN